MHSISADANEWMDLLDIPSDDDGASLADTSDLELMSSFVQQFPPGQHLADFFEQSSSVSLELSLAAANASQDFELREPVVQLKEETVPDDEDEYPETVDPLQVVLQPVILEVMTPPTTPVLGQALSVTRPSHSQPEQPKETVAAAPVPAPPSPLSSSIIVPASMGSGSGTRCMNCNIRSTPLWRRFTTPTESGILCNACGLRIQTSYNMYIHVFMHVVDYKQYNCHRPIGQSVPHASFKRTSASERPVQVPNTSSVVLDLNKVAKKRRRTPAREDVFCENCGCNKTPLWRKNELGQTLCNACGLYFKSHRKHKPVGGTTPPSATSPKPETTLLTTNKDAVSLHPNRTS